jgi:hypothetical protein
MSSNRQIRSLVLCVDRDGSRRIWPAHVGGVVGLVGSRRVQLDRLDDQADDQGRCDEPRLAMSQRPIVEIQALVNELC